MLHELADRFEFQLMWHCGFQFSVRDVPDDFRGPAMPAFAQRVAGASNILDAAVIGQAAASLHRNPAQWREWGDYWSVARLFRQIWHLLVHFGSPATMHSRLPLRALIPAEFDAANDSDWDRRIDIAELALEDSLEG